MISLPTNERLAMLLNALGPDAAEAALDSMNESQANALKRLSAELHIEPPSRDELEYVIDDFFKYFQFALKTLQSNETGPSAPRGNQARRGAQAPVQVFPKITPSHDPANDLNRLDPFQIAESLRQEHPKTIALVLRQIDVQQAARVLEQLDGPARSQAVVQLSQPLTIPAPIVQQVLKTTVERACAVEYRAEAAASSQVLADLLRSLPKTMRVELMGQLHETDADLAEQVKARLYLFADVLRLEDRDVQTLLAQVESDVLILALQQCESSLADKLLSNLSKRARESILEEMEYKTNASLEEIEGARSKVVAAMAQLDESGEIKL